MFQLKEMLEKERAKIAADREEDVLLEKKKRGDLDDKKRQVA